MNTINSYNTVDPLEEQNNDPNKPENNLEKQERLKSQIDYVQKIAVDVFDDATYKGYLDYAGTCSKEEFEKMRDGDTARKIPSLRETVMKENLWNMEIEAQERKHSGFRNKLKDKIKREGVSSNPVDRRILMAETAWEMAYKEMEKSIPENLKKDFKKYYGNYDRKRGVTKHNITEYNQIIPDLDAVTARMEKGVMERIVLEYKMAANSHFPKDTVKLWHKYIDSFKDPKSACKAYEKLIERYIPEEENFNKKRQELQEKNPAAHDFFLRLYNKSTQEKLYDKREDVMDKAVEHIQSAMDELSSEAKKEGKEVSLDFKDYQSLEDIMGAIKKVKEPSVEEDKKEETEPTSEDLKKQRDELIQNAMNEDFELHKLSVAEMTYENAAKAALITEHQDEAAAQKKAEAEMRLIKENRLKEKLQNTETENSEREAANDGEYTNVEKTEVSEVEIMKETHMLGMSGKGVIDMKSKEQIADLAQMQLDAKGAAQKGGLSFLKIFNTRGKKANSSDMKSEAQNTRAKIEKRKDAIIKNAIIKGDIDKKVNNLDNQKESQSDAKKRRDAMLKNIGKFKKTG